MIVVATDDFAFHHAAVNELRERGATFTTAEPGETLPERAAVVLSAPDDRPGIAVLSGDTVVAAFHVPLADAVGTVREAIAGEPDALVRVGDGDRLRSARVVNELADGEVTIDAALARRVALGGVTMEEALAEYDEP